MKLFVRCLKALTSQASNTEEKKSGHKNSLTENVKNKLTNGVSEKSPIRNQIKTQREVFDVKIPCDLIMFDQMFSNSAKVALRFSILQKYKIYRNIKYINDWGK